MTDGAQVIRRWRRWYRLAWYPTIAGCALLLAVPPSLALAAANKDWLWIAAAPPLVLVSLLLLAAAFGLWSRGVATGIGAVPHLPEVAPAALPLRVPASVLVSPVALLFATILVMMLEAIVIAVTVDRAGWMALAFVLPGAISLAPATIGIAALRLLGPQVIIDAEGVQLPPARVALRWEQVAEIRAYDGPSAGLAILPHQGVRLPATARLSRRHGSSPWLLVPEAMMATAVETVVSTAIHARNARLQHVAQIGRAT